MYYELDNENGTYTEMNDVQAYTVDNSGILKKFSTYVAKNDNEESSSTIEDKPSNNTSTPQKTNINKNDSTKASGTLPYAGVIMRIIAVIVLVLIGGIFAYFKYNRLRDI